MKIVVTYDSTVSSAPAGFTAAVQAAVAYYESHFDAPVTINITIGWGSAAGEMIPDGAVGASSPEGILLTYDQVRNALWYDARTSNTLTAAMNLPAADPTNGGMFFMTTAQAKAVGLLAGDDTGSDGTIIIDDASAYTFDPNNRAVAGKYDIIGVLEHEIGHILGRISFLGETLPGGAKLYGALDLFRYSAPGTLAPAATNTYFSIDGQNLLLPFNDPSNGGTESDWSIAITGDVYDAFAELGVQPQFSATDLIMQDLFGYHPHQGQPATPTANVAPSNTITVSSTYAVGQGQTVYFKEDPGNSAVWGFLQSYGSLSNAGTIIASSPTGIASEVAAVRAYGDALLFTNTATGKVYVLATWPTANAYGFQGLQFGYSVDNAGLFQVVSEGNATGSMHAGISPPSFTNRSTGVVNVWAGNRGVGVAFTDTGIFNNAGLINVVAKEAVGVTGATSFNNSGVLRVTNTGSGSGPLSIAVQILAGSVPIGQFINSGTIQGDYAFYSTTPLPVTIVNSGKIIGHNLFADSDVTIQNTGIIGGDIFFGNSTNRYSGASGALYGNIYLGMGADIITLGAASGTVYGGGGVATITGGVGNDFIQISRGATTINGGGGFNTLSFDNADTAVTVDLGAGTAFAGGNITLSNIQRVVGGRYDDTLKAGGAGATLIGGAGHDTLIGGAGNDTLIGGDGGDTATGNGGNDTFIYTAGNGQLVITDFRANGNLDVLKIFGYASAVSVQQQGADTRITLSGSDSILLKNVLTSSLSGALTYSAAAYTPVLLPGSAPVFGSSTIFVDQDLRIYAGEHINETFQNIGFYNRGYSLDNFGDVHVNYATASATDTTYGWVPSIFYKTGIQITSFNQSVVNEAGATFRVTNATGHATGFFTAGGSLVNAGNISVTAGGDAVAVETDAQTLFTNSASGSVNVNAQGKAFGLDYVNGANIRNDGLFSVTGGTLAYGLWMDRAEGKSITNTGVMTVSAGGGGQSYGIAFAGIGIPGTVTTITNSGTITAQDAIFEFRGGSSVATFPNANVTNSGTINGNITLSDGSHQLRNSGSITGLVRFGDGSSSYNGVGGTLSGAIYLGYGTNSVTLGNGGEVVFGASYGGVNVITGGSGDDFIQLTRGSHAINGGGGFNTVSFANAGLGIAVDLGAGTASAAGNDTLLNVQKIIGSGFNDVLTAGNTAATLVAGAGQDILTGGAGNDTLIAGPGGDTLTGRGGNDTFVYASGGQQAVITDFGANGDQDVLKIYGYASALSVQQQGADTLITLSGSDKVLLRNVVASSLTGGKLVYSSGALPAGPTLPAAPAMFGTARVDFSDDFKIYAGEHVAVTGPLGLYNTVGNYQLSGGPGINTAHSLDNAGSITVGSPSGDVTGMSINMVLRRGGVFANQAGATFSVTASNGSGTGVFAGAFSGDIFNAGTYSVTASGTAYGVNSYDGSFGYTNGSGGVMSIASSLAEASGVFLPNSGTVQNDGAINVIGKTNVYGIWAGSYQPVVTNTGTITVTGQTGAATTYGIYMPDASGSLTINNSGTISAQKAIYTPTGSYSNSIRLTNSGTINGDIDLGVSNQDTIASTGTINGNILLHGGRTTVDIRGGTLNGSVQLTAGPIAFAQDLIYTGAATATIKITGGQSYLTATVRASQAGHTTVEYDMASSGANWTKQSDGSWLVSAGSRGTQTLINVEALRFTDKTVSLPFTLTWTGSFSGDFTGDGRADILWQRSNGTAQLWGTDSGGAIVSNTVSSLADPELTTVLAVADYNGDGKDDILLRSFTGAVTLRLMNGASVTDTRNLQAMDSSWSVRGSGDFDGDGKADILWQKTDGTVVIWQMKANGDVASGTTLGVVSGAWSLSSVSDYNGDGKADVLLRNADGNVYDWIMNGAGIAGSNSLGIMENSWSVKGAGDFGGDGKSDLLWQKSDGSTVIWQMNGAGAVGSGTNLGVVNPAIWSLSAVADYNGDGKADVLLRNADGSLANWLMNGAAIAGSNSLGTADAPTLKPPPPVASDFGGDGRADILWQNADGSGVIWHMSSAGAVDTMSNLSAVTAAYSGVGDFNGDGKTDILLRDTDGSVASRLMNGGVITSTNSLGSMDGSWSLKGLGDFGGEGRSDILWQKSDGNVVIWQTNAGGTSYSATALGAVDPTVWSLLNVADFNGDGKADVLLRNSNGAVYNWIMNGAGIAGSNSLGTMDSSWSVKGAGDFGGDGKSDLLWQKSDGTIVIWQMNGNGTVASVTNLGAVSPSVWSLANVADYNGDGKADVLLRNANGSVANWLMNGAAIIGSNNLGAMDSSAVVVPGVRRKTPNDFGGDGRADILWQKSDGTTLIWNMNGSGTVGSSTNLGIMDLSVPIVSLGDYNGDGRTDILVRNNATGSVSGLLMGASGIAATKALGVMDSSWSVKGSGDLGGDGRADMLWQKTDGTVVIWQMNGAGTISSATDIGVVNPGIWSLSSIADYNGDGKADVLLRNANGAVYNWIMNGAVIAGSNSLGTMDSTWSVKGTGDFDGDGKADLLWQKSDGTTLIWQMNGAGALASSTNLGVVNPSAWSLSGVADYNADGKADVLLRNVNGSVDSWLMNGATIAGSSTLGSMNNSWTAITR